MLPVLQHLKQPHRLPKEIREFLETLPSPYLVGGGGGGNTITYSEVGFVLNSAGKAAPREH